MRKIINNATLGNLWFRIISAVIIILLNASFILPPAGAIDPTALKGSAILLALAALWVARDAIIRGFDAKLTHGDTSIELNNPDNDNK